MTSLSGDEILDALLAETGPSDKREVPSDKQTTSPQIVPSDKPTTPVVATARDNASFLTGALRDARREHVWNGRAMKELRPPRAVDAGRYVGGGTPSVAMYNRVNRHLSRLAFRTGNELKAAGVEKPTEAELALALENYLLEAVPKLIVGGQSKFEKWTTVTHENIEKMSRLVAIDALRKCWDEGDQYTKMQKRRGAAGGRKSKRRPDYSEHELDLVAQSLDWSVGEHVELFDGRYSRATIERMRRKARQAGAELVEAPLVELAPNVILFPTPAVANRKSDERREAIRARLEQDELDKRTQAAAVAQNEADVLAHEAEMLRVAHRNAEPRHPSGGVVLTEEFLAELFG